MLPSDLSTSLKYLDNADLQKLRAAVTAEIDRRAQQRPQSDVSSAVPLSAAIQNTVSTVDELPEGKANLIRASFSAGLKPAAIARIFHISQTLVSRVIRPTDKPKRIGH
jgi:DNA invertase Pin-like site-specific DNA recombinase